MSHRQVGDSRCVVCSPEAIAAPQGARSSGVLSASALRSDGTWGRRELEWTLGAPKDGEPAIGGGTWRIRIPT